jgi:hypothetical protein
MDTVLTRPATNLVSRLENTTKKQRSVQRLFERGIQLTASVSPFKTLFITSVRLYLIRRSVSTSGRRLISPAKVDVRKARARLCSEGLSGATQLLDIP